LPRSRLRPPAPAEPGHRDADSARLVILRLLVRRELSERQARERLERREFPPESIDAAIASLKKERALDDDRVARACARTELELKRRGPARAVRQIERLGIPRDRARQAVAEVAASLDTGDLLRRALARRLPRDASIPDRATFARLYRFLIGQGFPSDKVMEALRERQRQAATN
jgi:SOS response regulatory protein OraA/RecX